MSCQTVLPTTVIKTQTQNFEVEVATTPQQRTQGLMHRTNLPKNHGMLFIFETEDLYGFWMKNTHIPLDIVWISQDKTVVDIQTVPPCTTESCPTFTPKQKAQYVLEVNAHEFTGKVGDPITWKFPSTDQAE